MQSSDRYPLENDFADKNGTLDRGRSPITMAPSQARGQTLNIHGSNFTNVGVVNLKMMQIYYSENHEVKVPGWISAFDFSEMHNDLSKKRTPGTGTWFLHSEEFTGWILGPHRNILWCPGIPGAGKTIIGSLVIDHLRRHTQDTAVIYLYFTYKLHNQQNLSTSIQTLSRQVHEICRTKELPSDFERLYISHLDHKTRPSVDELLDALRTTLKPFKQVYVILDALDEYLEYYSDAKVRQLLTTVRSFGDHVKILATSRNVGQMEALLNELNAIRKEIVADSNDLEKFVNAGIATLDHFEVSTQLSQQVVQKVQEAAKGRFLMAELHMNVLSKQLTPGDLKELLNSLPSEVDKTYESAMERINKSGDVLKELAKKTLMWVACARRPMAVGELQHALATKHDRTHITDFLPSISTITSACVGLVVVEDGRVVFVHLTTQEFFHKQGGRYFPQAHKEIGRTCLDYLLLPCFLELAPSYLSRSKGQADLYENYPFYAYASLNWGFHVNTCGVDEHLAENILETLRQVDDRLKLAWMYPLNTIWWGDVCTDGVGLFLALYHQQTAPFFALMERTYIPITNKGLTPFIIAAHLGLPKFIELMVQMWGVDCFYPEQEAGDTQLSDTEKSGRMRAHVASPDIQGDTPLSYAARKGHTAVVKLLLQYPTTQVNSPNKYGRTALLMAASEGQDDIVELLVEHKDLHVNLQDRNGWSALISAARRGYTRTVELLLRHPKIDINLYKHKNTKWTALMYAVLYGHESIVGLLLEHPDIDVNVQESLERYTALLLAAEAKHALFLAAKPKHQAITELLLKCPTLDVNLRNKYGRTALRIVAELGLHSLVQLLLEHPEIDVNLADHNGVSPFLAASKKGDTSTLKLLLDYQKPSQLVGSLQDTVEPSTVEVHARDNDGWSALAVSAWNGCLPGVELLLNCTDIDPDLGSSQGCTPLAMASQRGHADIVQLLLDRGQVNINNIDNDGDTPLMCAAYSGHTSVARLLLNQPGIQVNVQDREDHRTALSKACDGIANKYGTKETEADAYAFVELLLEHKDIDVNLADGEGRTPLYYASRSGFQKVIELMQGRGAVMRSEAEIIPTSDPA